MELLTLIHEMEILSQDHGGSVIQGDTAMEDLQCTARTSTLEPKDVRDEFIRYLFYLRRM